MPPRSSRRRLLKVTPPFGEDRLDGCYGEALASWPSDDLRTAYVAAGYLRHSAEEEARRLFEGWRKDGASLTLEDAERYVTSQRSAAERLVLRVTGCGSLAEGCAELLADPYLHACDEWELAAWQRSSIEHPDRPGVDDASSASIYEAGEHLTPAQHDARIREDERRARAHFALVARPRSERRSRRMPARPRGPRIRRTAARRAAGLRSGQDPGSEEPHPEPATSAALSSRAHALDGGHNRRRRTS